MVTNVYQKSFALLERWFGIARCPGTSVPGLIRVSPALLLGLMLLQANPVMARSDDLLQREIEAGIAESRELRDTQIKVHVEERLVVLAGQVRLYKQKMIGDRIAWTTPGVFEVDNAILVVPRLPLSDEAIDLKIREILKQDARFHGAGVVVTVTNGEVSLKGSFLDFRDPSVLKNRVAEIKGVVDIKISAVFLT